jgi:hypothetical protein
MTIGLEIFSFCQEASNLVLYQRAIKPTKHTRIDWQGNGSAHGEGSCGWLGNF